MIIRKAKATDAHDLKVLYFEHLTQFPPKEGQHMIERITKEHLPKMQIGGGMQCSIRNVLLRMSLNLPC